MTLPQQCEVNIIRSGMCHGLIMWWELSLCPNVSISTSPWNRTQVTSLLADDALILAMFIAAGLVHIIL